MPNRHHSKSVTDYLRHTCSIDLIKASLYCGRDKASKALKSLNKQILQLIILIMMQKSVNKSAIHQYVKKENTENCVKQISPLFWGGYYLCALPFPPD